MQDTQKYQDLQNKRTNGQYFTEFNPFNNSGFAEWSASCDIINQNVLEPFAGSNNLIKMLQNMGFCNNFSSFDLEPQDEFVQLKDTLLDFPSGFKVCVTNPPYLAQNSAKRRGLFFPDTIYDDLYKIALDKCLQNCDYVAAIIPASFLNSKLFRNRLSHYILLSGKMFSDTEHPVCLALFEKKATDVKIFENAEYLGLLSEFEKKIPQSTQKIDMKFNDKNGKLGLIAIDNTIEPSIRFCKGSDINPDNISVSSRSITRISIDADVDKIIKKLNDKLMSFREETHDLFLTPFKGLRKDNKYRKRISFGLTRKIINELLYV